MTRIDEIRARLAASTPGPWEAHESPPGVWGVWRHIDLADLPDGGLVDYEIAQQGDESTLADSHLIANAPADLAFLLDVVNDLVGALSEIAEDDGYGDNVICARRVLANLHFPSRQERRAA